MVKTRAAGQKEKKVAGSRKMMQSSEISDIVMRLVREAITLSVGGVSNAMEERSKLTIGSHRYQEVLMVVEKLPSSYEAVRSLSRLS